MIIIGSSKTLFCSSKFSWARKSISLKLIEILGTHPQKDLSAINQAMGWKIRFSNVGKKRHPQHSQTGFNSSTTAADSSNGVTNTRCCRYSYMRS
jgi:hypothetical protein